MRSMNEILEELIEGEVVHHYIDSATAISEAISPGVPFRLESLDLHASATLDSAENLTVTKVAGRGINFNTVLLSEDLYVGTRTSYHASFGEGYEFAADDSLVIAQANGSGDSIGIDITYKKL